MYETYSVEVYDNGMWVKWAWNLTYPEAIAIKADAERHGDKARIGI